MMDWIRNNGFPLPVRAQRAITAGSEEGCDPTACFVSFKEHWQQAWIIIQRNQQLPKHDDVLAVVNHLEQMVQLLGLEVKNSSRRLVNSSRADCLEYLLEENLLDRLFTWSIGVGRYINAVRLEQLILFETLLNHSRHTLLVRDVFLRPLLKLLDSCENDVLPKESEKRLISLLYQLCVVLVQNLDLVDLFVTTEPTPKFTVFKLLIRYVHREDSIGMKARDALLLCMNLSKKKRNVTDFLLRETDLCMLLVSGIIGLYSMLPTVLNDITAPDWHRLTPDDVKDIKELSTFITSLEFSNAVAQVAHTDIARELEKFMHGFFLCPILGHALVQSDVREQITAVAYLELILRTVTQPGLLYPLLQFLLQSEYEEGKTLSNILIERINSEPQLALVSLALFESLIDINCEDVMLDLVFQYLRPCLHVMLSQRCASLPLDVCCQNLEKFLALAPNCCGTVSKGPRVDGRPVYFNQFGNRSLYGNYHAYLCDARNKINICRIACSCWTNAYEGCGTKSDYGDNETASVSFGYESLKQKIEKNGEDEAKLPEWQTSSKEPIKKQETEIIDDRNCLTTVEAIGPFLTAILNKLKDLLENTIYVNLHLTGLISRLAVYPQPLLRAYLLDHSLILQPNIPSLFQIIASQKNTIDGYMLRKADSAALIEEARLFLVERESRLVYLRRGTVDRTNAPPATSEPEPAFQRNVGKRRSIPSLAKMFWRPSQSEARDGIPMIAQPDAHEPVEYPKFTEEQHVALCAVLLDEWVKELAALAQEHAISQLTSMYK